MKKLLLLSAAILAMQALPALAQDAPPPGEGSKPPHEGKRHDMMEKFDTDKDGKISEAESLAAAKARFKETDANGDGYITKEEGKAHHEEMRKKWGEKRKEMKEKRDAVKGGDAPAKAE